MIIPEYKIGDALAAADCYQRNRSHRGYGHVSGGQATADGLTVTVPDTTEMYIDGATIQVDGTANAVDLQPDDRWPRWASITVDATGVVDATHGRVNRPLEVNSTPLTGREAARPAPPVTTATDHALHTLAWIPANADTVTLIDRRLDANLDAPNVSTTGDDELTTLVDTVVTLSSGSAVVATGATTTGTRIGVFLDPSGDGANAADVKAAARAFWDNSAGEYKIEVLEDGTSVGNPDIGVTAVKH